MADPIGVTFVPSDEQALLGRKNLATAGGIPEAIRFISLQIPKFAGARAIAPDQLLQSPGGGGQAASVVESILRSMGLGGGDRGLGGILDDAVNNPPPGAPGLPPPPRVRPGARSPFGRPPSDPGPRPRTPYNPPPPRVGPGIAGPPLGNDPTYPGYQPGEVDFGPSAPDLPPPPVPAYRPPLRKDRTGDLRNPLTDLF